MPLKKVKKYISPSSKDQTVRVNFEQHSKLVQKNAGRVRPLFLAWCPGAQNEGGRKVASKKSNLDGKTTLHGRQSLEGRERANSFKEIGRGIITLMFSCKLCMYIVECI